MDLDAPFKPEVLRPFISIAVPGLIAVSPFILLVGHYVPPVATFWQEHPHAFAVLLAVTVLAAGFIISDFGELIEVHWWDNLQEKRDPNHLSRWHNYLKLQLNDELIAHRFLRTKLTQFKFELAMVPALVIFWIGLLWLQLVRPIWTTTGFVLFSGALWFGAGYLLWESWNSSQALARIRTYILEAITEGPKGIKHAAPGA